MKKIIFFLFIIIFSPIIFAQTPDLKKMKIIRANSDTVAIRDGNAFYSNGWSIVPSAKPDIRITRNKRITFITDLDSITFNTEPYKSYNFVILMGKDSAWTQIQCLPSYLDVLKKAGNYQVEKTDNLPKFSYLNMDDNNLKNVRETFKLDSIAGNGNEISKILNLLHWVHNSIRHDGNNYANCELDAIDLFNYYKATGKGVNCRHLAMVLNECYLSMGIKSRFITCLPKDSTDTDCHVINSVYSETLKKWIWIDPTFNAYVKDENGNFLGIEEVRDRLIDGRPLVLNEDANWNNEKKQTKENYLYNYMAKNLYWLNCSANSKFNTESRYRYSGETYVSLVPSDFKPFEYISGVVTTDTSYFWQTPN